jgi:type IV pilus assembly PilX-like protein
MIPTMSVGDRARARQGGSAYIIALLVLVVLTALGLTLSLVTQTEMHIGANERVVQRHFYAADSGVASSTARALVINDYSEQIYTIPGSGPLQLDSKVDVSPYYPILRAPCNLCEINDPGMYGEKQYFKVNHGLTSTGGSKQGAQTVSAMVELQPHEDVPESHLALQDPAQLARIKF